MPARPPQSWQNVQPNRNEKSFFLLQELNTSDRDWLLNSNSALPNLFKKPASWQDLPGRSGQNLPFCNPALSTALISFTFTPSPAPKLVGRMIAPTSGTYRSREVSEGWSKRPPTKRR